MNIVVSGDFAPTGRLVKIIKERKFHEIIPYNLKELIKSVDFSFVNFESPVIERSFAPIIKCGPNLGCSAEAVEAVKYAGFTGVTLANNHILDYGKKGLNETVKTCIKHGLYTVGVGDNIEIAAKTLYIEQDGKELAVINCCENEFSIATETDAGANPLNPIFQYYAIREAKNRADYVLVIVHGGHEHYQLPSVRMQETYRFFIDAGADAVVNHHQHCYSGYEVYNGKPIFYGLGNFLFDRQKYHNSEWNNGYLVELNFNENEVNFCLYPYEQCNEKIGVQLLQDRSEFDKRIEHLNTIITDPLKLRHYNGDYYTNTIQSVNALYQPYENRILNKLYRLHLLPSIVSKKKFLQIYNYINCEAHRDKQLFALKKIIEK